MNDIGVSVWVLPHVFLHRLKQTLMFSNDTEPPPPLFTQIMIEFCPGGAVDATMLGRYPTFLPILPHGSVVTLQLSHFTSNLPLSSLCIFFGKRPSSQYCYRNGSLSSNAPESSRSPAVWEIPPGLFSWDNPHPHNCLCPPCSYLNTDNAE